MAYQGRRGRRVWALVQGSGGGWDRIASARALDLNLRRVSKLVFERLVKAGAFDLLATGEPALEPPATGVKPRLFAAIDAACEHGARHRRDRHDGQAGTFGGAGSGPAALQETAHPEAAPCTGTEQLAYQQKTRGLH